VGVLMLEHPAFGPGDVGVGHAPQRERQRLDDEIIDGELVGWLALLVLGRRSVDLLPRSEERRVGKECRSRWSPYHSKKKPAALAASACYRGCAQNSSRSCIAVTATPVRTRPPSVREAGLFASDTVPATSASAAMSPAHT